MPKLVFLCRRRPDLTHERYAELLLRGHVPIALRHHPTMRAYVVNVVEGRRAGAEELDSIGELTFDSLDDFRERLYDSDAGRKIVEADVAGFMGGAHAYVTREHVQKRPAADAPLGTRSQGVKIIGLVRRPDGMTHEAFVEHWLERHVPLALRHHPGLHKYVTNVVEARLGDAPDWDGIAELHFPSVEAMRTQFFDSPDGERIIREDMPRFIGQTWGYDVAEYAQRRA
jgi:uncharacterized protein (TIGR02118 family)